MSRFDYVKYDETAQTIQNGFKQTVENLEKAVNGLKPGRSSSLALTALEEFYTWVGKAIRDDQVARNTENNNS